MRIISIKNPEVLATPFTLVSQDYSSGTLLNVEDSSNFAENQLILVGGIGNEKAEVTDLTAAPPSAGSLAITALSHAHSTDESVQPVSWDKFDIQTKASLTGIWGDLATAVDFDWSQDETNYTHTTGASTDYYRSRFYNSATSVYSEWSDAVSGEGLTRSQVGSMIAEVRKFAKDQNDQKADDQTIVNYLNYAQDIIKSLDKKWSFLQGEHTINTVADSGGYDFPADFKRAYRLKFTLIDGTSNQTYYLRYLPTVDFDNKYSDNTSSSDDNLVDYTIDTINKKIKVGPKPKTANLVMTLVYEKDIVDLKTYADTTVIPLPEILIDYATSKVCRLKSNPEDADKYMDDFSDLLKVLDQTRPVVYHPKTFKRYMGQRGFRNAYGSFHQTEDSL